MPRISIWIAKLCQAVRAFVSNR